MEHDNLNMFDKFERILKIQKECPYNNFQLRYMLLFKKPLDEKTRKIAELVLWQDPESKSPLVYDELEKLGKKTRENYRAIIEMFDPVTNPTSKEDFMYPYAFALFTGRVEYNPTELGEKLTPEMRDSFVDCYKNIRKHLRGNRLTPKFMDLFEKAENVLSEPRSLNDEVYEAWRDLRLG